MTNRNTIQDVQTLADKLMNEVFTVNGKGQTIISSCNGLGFKFKFDNAKNRFGSCNSWRRIITLSKPLSLANLDNMVQIEDTIRHEIAHAFANKISAREGHGSLWKSVATQVGARPERCFDSNDANLVKTRFVWACPNGHQSPIHKVTAKVRMSLGGNDTMFGSKSCGICGKEHGTKGYQQQFKMKAVDTHAEPQTPTPKAEPKPQPIIVVTEKAQETMPSDAHRKRIIDNIKRNSK